MWKRFVPITVLLVMLALGTLPLGERAATQTARAQGTTPTPVAQTPTATPTLQPDLTVTVSVNFDPVTAGQVLTFFLTVHNNGDVLAAASTLTALVPPGTTVNSLATGCTEDSPNQQIRCRLLPLAPGE